MAPADPKQVELVDPQAQKMNRSASTDWNDWRSRTPKSAKKSKSPANPEAVLKGKYLEVFQIGGGTKWLYAFMEFIMAILLFLKSMGVPGFGQVLVPIFFY